MLGADAWGNNESLLLLGDLNAHDEPEVLEALAAHGLRDCWNAARTRDGDGLTSPSERPVQRIDYVLAGPAWDVLEAMVPSATTASATTPWASLSDHLPLTVHLTPVSAF